jgi:periplasmic divalent cation tolerance protein
MYIIYVPVKDVSEGKRIASTLMKNKLAFCGNIIPSIFSVYRWKGTVENGKEALLVVKTTKHALQDALTSIKKLHSYETVDMLWWKVNPGHPDVLSWVKEELGSTD